MPLGHCGLMAEEDPKGLAEAVPARSWLMKRSTKLLILFRKPDRIGAALRVTLIRVVAMGGNIASGLLTAAFLGPDGRGEQSALIVAPTTLAALSTLGLHASLIYNVRRHPTHASYYFGTAAVLCCVSGLVMTAVGWMILPFWLHQYGPDTILTARLLLLTLPVSVVSPLLTGVMEAHERFGVANKVLYLQSLTTLMALIALALFGHMTPLLTALAYILPCLPGAIYLWVHAVRVLIPRISLAPPIPGRLMRFGLRFYGVDILSALSGYLDQVTIIFLLNPDAVGAYAVALSLSRVLNVVQGAVSTVLFPTIAGRERGALVETVGRVTRVTLVMNTGAAVGLAFVGPPLLLWLYGERFAGAIAPFLVLLVEAVVSSAARTLAQAFSGSGRPGAVTEVEMAGVATTLCCMFMLVPLLGIVGAACATMLSGLARLGWVMVRFNRVLGHRRPKLLLTWADLQWVMRA